LVLFSLFVEVNSALAQGGGGGGGGGGAGGGGGGGGGGADGGSGGTLSDSGIVIMVLVVGVVAAVASTISNRELGRRRLVNVVLLVRRGASYARKLDDLVMTADFSLPKLRWIFLSKVAQMIEQEDVVASWVDVDKAPRSDISTGVMKSMWERQQQRAKIVPRVMNVAGPDGVRYNRLSEVPPLPDSDDGLCLIGLIFVRDLETASRIETGISLRGEFDAYGNFGEIGTGDPVYIYYSPRDPDTDGPLGEDRAREMVRRIAGTEDES